MSSDKRKPGGRTKAQTTSKTNFKQKSILDSFTVKSTPKSISNPSSLQVTHVDDFPNTIAPVEDDEIRSLSLNNVQEPSSDTIVPLPETSVQVVDLTELPDIDSETHLEEIKERLRSPSIVTLDTDLTTDIPTHSTSFLTKKSRTTVEGRTRDKPIVIPSSPIKISASSKANAVHPFFASKPKLRGSSVATSKTVLPVLDPPYPNSESQHVRGPQTQFHSCEAPFPKRHPTFSETMTGQKMDYAFLKRHDIVADGSTDTGIHRTSDSPNESSNHDIPPEHTLNHPAIARLVNDGMDGLPPSSRPWSDKWRPSCAKEVLGNESSAVYLRNWLRALELQLEDHTGTYAINVPTKHIKGKPNPLHRGTKRSRVVRAVEKRRKKSRLDSDEEDDHWIAYSDESEEEVDYEEIDEFGDILLPEVPASSQSSTTYDIPPPSLHDKEEEDLGQLHNTILLSGPSGSGKTACVYACAEELGWDVFEVYPGVGRRNGANVDNLVGEVGKNHLVLQNRRSGDVMKSFLTQKKRPGADDESANGYLMASYSPRKKTRLDDISEPESSSRSPKSVRQSLILLEEVDILYKEDVNFWNTVTRIIKECKRPVICTCNDISLVPVEDLPLQSIIQFESCSNDIATSYLQALCSVEGYSANRDMISRLYAYPHLDQDSTAQNGVSIPDLRRTLNALQMKCTTLDSHAHKPDSEPQQSSSNLKASLDSEDNAPETHAVSPKPKPHTSVAKTDFLSYLDSNLMKDPHLTVMELGSHLPSGDDEIGHTLLYDIYAADKVQYGHYDRHEDMICSTIELSSRLFDVNVRDSNSSGKILEGNGKKSRYEQLTVLREICPPEIWSRGLMIEYLPYVRLMVESEDVQDAKEMEKRPQTGRKTRNSARSEFVRMIELSPEGRRLLGLSGFNIVEGA